MENIVVGGNEKHPLFCRKCGTKLHENSTFCHNCGTKTAPDSAIEEKAQEPVPVIHTPNHTETIKKRKKKPIIIGTIIVVVIILISVLIAIFVGNNSNKEIHNVCLRTITFSDKFTAEYVYSTWENGKATEQSLVELMNKYGAEQGDQGAGRLYLVVPGEYVKEIDEWCFSPKRKIGDCAIIENVYGYSICYISDINCDPDYYVDTEMVTYSWYDADGELLFEETISEDTTPTAYALPADTEKWNYTEWVNGENANEKIARREPQHSYFAGNVFQIVIKDLGGQPVSTGSAFVFHEDGWFITNAHVMEDAYYAEAIFDIPNNQTGESYTYLSINTGTYYHLDKDVYIGKVYNYASIKSYYHEISTQVNYEIGEQTYSVGYPNSSAELVINEGTVTETWSDIYEKLYNGHKYICSSSDIAPGSSGGILTNADLEVIGITTLGWFDNNDQFISGASISTFNFNQFLGNTNEKKLTALIDRFHADEKVYIGYFNEAKFDATIGEAEEYYFDDGTLAYIYEWEDEGVNGDGDAYTRTETFLVGSDGWMSYNDEIYWHDGERRTISFHGYYDHQKGFANFKFTFEYEWSDGDWYAVTCSDINYSSNISLTLNRCVVDSSYFYNPSDDDVEYAKEQFNWVYEWLTEDMARFE